MAVVQLNFQSKYIQNSHTAHIILPDLPQGMDPAEFYRSGRKFKVLWLLHGGSGDSTDWLRRTSIELYACERELIVVMPSVGNSRYSNAEHFGKPFDAFDYLTEELMPLVYAWYPASRAREDNYIAGLSMGGEGALKFAVNHTDKFNSIAILSAAARNFYTMDRNHPVLKKYIHWFGSFENVINSYENIWDKLPLLLNDPNHLRIFAACGTADDIAYPAFCEFREYAEKLGIDAHFETQSGYRHEWRFWDIYIQRALDYFGLLPKYRF